MSYFSFFTSSFLAGCFDIFFGLGYPSDEESDDKYEREFERRFDESVSVSDSDSSEFVVPDYVFTEFDIFCNNL